MIDRAILGNACVLPITPADERETSALVNIRAYHWWSWIHRVCAVAPPGQSRL
jgi:hypothetical protein